MLSAALGLHLLALSVWLGAVVYLSFAVAPILFRSFPTEQAGTVMSALFPTYYRVGYACGAVLLVSALALWRSAGTGRWALSAAVAAAALAACVWAGAVIQPRANALRPELRDEGTAATAKPEFDRLHRRAVQLNGAVLFANLVLLGVVASRLRP